MQDETYTCAECGEGCDSPESSDTRWSNVKNSWVCWPCFESASQYASVLWIIDEDGPRKYYVSDVEVITEHGDDADGKGISRTYVPTSGWRGYHVTKIDGWTEIESGWTTGGWGDPIADGKRPLNEWAESLVTGDEVPPFPVALAFDPTSNVFSTAVSVYVKADNDSASPWDALAGDKAERLSLSLR